jgi:hypothetical protein
LGIALENRNVGIIRYLVVEKGIQLSGEKDITMDTLCRNLDLVLRLLPEEASRNTGNATEGGLQTSFAEESALRETSGDSASDERNALNDGASDASLDDVSNLKEIKQANACASSLLAKDMYISNIYLLYVFLSFRLVSFALMRRSTVSPRK